jgi:transcriptional regulator GlxA family with amidase domain
MLEQGRLSLDVIASEVGFVDRNRMRQAFLRTLGRPPQDVRRFGRESRALAELPDGSRSHPTSPDVDA